MAKTEVSAGILRDSSGRILICRRGEGRKNAHLWEFPGGKREAGEDAEACLRRELREELRIEAANLRPCTAGSAQGIHFTFLTGECVGAPVRTEHEALRFVPARKLLDYTFCPADEPVAFSLALSDPPLTHFLWDFDGTVMDTYPAYVHALCGIAAELGLPLSPGRCLSLQKISLSHAVGVIAAESGQAEARVWDAVKAADFRTELLRSQPVKGIPELLRALCARGAKHYLVTHHDLDCLQLLKSCGLMDCFTGWVTAENGFPRKPAPDSIEYLLGKYCIDPRNAVMIGDRPLDTEAGRAAGILSILLDEDDRFAGTACDLRVSDIPSLHRLLFPPEGLHE